MASEMNAPDVPNNRKSDGPDFVGLWDRFKKLDSGHRAALRRLTTPDDSRDTVALYRLFPHGRATDGWLRIAFLLPWCEHRSRAPAFGASLAKEKVSEARVLQMARAADPLDVVQLRRLAIQIKPAVDWTTFGWTLLKWRPEDKRRVVEDFFYSKTTKKRA